MTGLSSKIVAWTLNSGDHRGVTWHDKDAGVVWLLASHFHRSGASDDAYPRFRRLDGERRLLPTEADYLNFEQSQAPTFARALLEAVPIYRSRARELPETVYDALLE